MHNIIPRVGTTVERHVATGCCAAELVWPTEKAHQFRQLMIEALGRDCVCEPGGSCWLLDAAIKAGQQRALEDGIVEAFAAVQRDAEEDEGPSVATVYLTAQNQGLDGATVIERVAELARQ